VKICATLSQSENCGPQEELSGDQKMTKHDTALHPAALRLHMSWTKQQQTESGKKDGTQRSGRTITWNNWTTCEHKH